MSKAFTVVQVMKRTGLARSSLANWRVQKKGPAYGKAGKLIVYPAKTYLPWEKKFLSAKKEKEKLAKARKKALRA